MGKLLMRNRRNHHGNHDDWLMMSQNKERIKRKQKMCRNHDDWLIWILTQERIKRNPKMCRNHDDWPLRIHELTNRRRKMFNMMKRENHADCRKGKQMVESERMWM